MLGIYSIYPFDLQAFEAIPPKQTAAWEAFVLFCESSKWTSDSTVSNMLLIAL